LFVFIMGQRKFVFIFWVFIMGQRKTLVIHAQSLERLICWSAVTSPSTVRLSSDVLSSNIAAMLIRQERMVSPISRTDNQT
jgi:hypothetical protein